MRAHIYIEHYAQQLLELAFKYRPNASNYNPINQKTIASQYEPAWKGFVRRHIRP